MPSKRTNDSVDRILQDLNMQQAEAGLRDSVTDRQVDEILRSVGISTTDAPPMPQNGFAFGGADGLDELLNAPANKAAAPQPAQSRPAPAQPVPHSRPRKARQGTPRRPSAAIQPAPASSRAFSSI